MGKDIVFKDLELRQTERHFREHLQQCNDTKTVAALSACSSGDERVPVVKPYLASELGLITSSKHNQGAPCYCGLGEETVRGQV